MSRAARIRVLIAEDSATIREYLALLVGGDPGLEVAGTAKDGLEAVEAAERLRPDLVLMDVHMPRMSGCEAARTIMERAPTPIVMISASFRKDEVVLTFQALEAGALTVVDKPAGPGQPGEEESVAALLETIRLMSEVRVVRRWPRKDTAGPATRAPDATAGALARTARLVAIGASTGGPAVLARILKHLPPDLGAPILVVQHIAPGFAAGLAEWLGGETPLAVKLAEHGETARPGTVYVAPNGQQMEVASRARLRLTTEPDGDGFRPSATHLLESVAEVYGPAGLGIVLTGMGRDGSQGLLALRRAGGTTVAQDEASSAVFGMPAEAIRLEAAEYVLSPEEIAALIRSAARAPGREEG